MTDDDLDLQRRDDLPMARMSAPLAAIGLVLSLVVPLIIAFWIVHIRWEWMEAFPQETLRKPPTISRAMADIPLGADMATWISVSAIFVPIAAAIVALLYIRTARVLPLPPRRRRRLAILGVGLALMEIPLAAGMVMQSVYTLEVDNDLHMLGSYLLFASAGFAQIVAIALSVTALRLLAACGTATAPGLIHAGAARARAWGAFCSLLLTLAYLALFILKDVFPHSAALYQTYVLTEIVVIVMWMVALMLHAVEFALILWSHGRSEAASRKPASPAEGR